MEASSVLINAMQLLSFLNLFMFKEYPIKALSWIYSYYSKFQVFIKSQSSCSRLNGVPER